MTVERAELLRRPVGNVEQAKQWITDLHALQLSFHFEDDPDTIGNSKGTRWVRTFTKAEVPHVRARIEEIYRFQYGEHECPIGFLLSLDPPVKLWLFKSENRGGVKWDCYRSEVLDLYIWVEPRPSGFWLVEARAATNRGPYTTSLEAADNEEKARHQKMHGKPRPF